MLRQEKRRAKRATREAGDGDTATEWGGGGGRQAPAAAHANIRDYSPFQTPEFRSRRKKGGTRGPTVPLNRLPAPPTRVCQPFPNPRVTELPHHGNFHSVLR
ncbi:hypothetical protein VULLAG_LOCUS16527 [Vulpes lagopus]